MGCNQNQYEMYKHFLQKINQRNCLQTELSIFFSINVDKLYSFSSFSLAVSK